MTYLDKDICRDPPFIKSAPQHKQRISYPPLLGRKRVQLLPYHRGRNQHIVNIGRLPSPRIVHGAVCLYHCAFQNVLIGG